LRTAPLNNEPFIGQAAAINANSVQQQCPTANAQQILHGCRFTDAIVLRSHVMFNVNLFSENYIIVIYFNQHTISLSVGVWSSSLPETSWTTCMLW
jgi:hypothetical protein